MNSLDRLAKTLVEPLADKGTSPYETNATVIRLEDGIAWVQIPGGVEETPAVLAVSALPGDEVRVRVTGGKAYVTGNPSAPPTDDTLAQKAQDEAVDAAKAADEAATQAEDANRTATGAARDASVAKETAESSYHIAANTNQYFWHTESGEDTGAHITEIPREAFLLDPEHGGGNLLARSNGIAVRDGLTETASFGASGAQIGLDEDTHINLDYRSIRLVDKNDNAYFYVSDLRDASGVVQITDTFEGGESIYYLTYIASSPYTVTVSDGSGGNVDKNADCFIFENRTNPDATITAEYETDSDEAKAYTIGMRELGYEVGASSFMVGTSCVASGKHSHAEGYNTKAEGDYSHAAGWFTTASGNNSHAEGSNTTAEGVYSHAQNFGTYAANFSQTVIGTYNEIDESGDASHSGDYALIIGNGIANSARSNALTVDWLGGIEMYLDHNGTSLSDATSGTDKDLFNAIRALGWYSDVIV